MVCFGSSSLHENGSEEKITPRDGSVVKILTGDYYKGTGIIPIMHVLVMRRSIAERHPEMPQRFFELFSQAKKLARNWIRSVPSLTMAWKNHYFEEEEKLFDGRDPWAYGLKTNLTALTKFLSYCDAQGISARRITPYDLFAASTWELNEGVELTDCKAVPRSL